MLRLPETIDRAVDTACGCNCHCLGLRFFLVAGVRSRSVMIALASGFGMRVGRLSRTLTAVGVLAMPDSGLDTTRHVESVCIIPLGSGVLRLLVPGMAVGVIIDRRCVADGVEVTH
jgi:hypothetical protein